MDARLQRRIQRYGWDIAAPDYEPSWQAQLAVAQDEMLACAALQAGERVLDVACGTGLVTLRAAQAVGPQGEAIGTDISAGMIDIAWTRATAQRIGNVRFQRMGAESLDFPERRFDAVLCALGLMYVTHPEQALHEMRRVLRPGGKLLFVEHGLAPDERVRWWQDRLNPAWKSISGGCHLNRPIHALIEQAGFRIDRLETGYMSGLKPMTFMYEGSARPG